MKVLVTGANGLLGHHVVNELLLSNHQIRVMVRNVRNIHFDLTKVEIVIGSFTDEAKLDDALEGCDAVIHIAALVSHRVLNYEVYQQVNVNGTAMLNDKSIEKGVKSFIFISTSNTVGNGNNTLMGHEDMAMSFPFSNSLYAKSKLEAEELLLEKSTKSAMRLVIINPCFMIGPFDPNPSSGKLMLMGYKKRILFVPKGGKNFVSAVNTACTVCNALEKGRSGERYLVAGVNLSFSEFFKLQSEVGEYRQWIVRLPNWMLKLAGYMGDVLRKCGFELELCTMNIDQLLVQEYYSSQKAKCDLELEETDLRESIYRGLSWFKSTGKI